MKEKNVHKKTQWTRDEKIKCNKKLFSTSKLSFISHRKQWDFIFFYLRRSCVYLEDEPDEKSSAFGFEESTMAF